MDRLPRVLILDTDPHTLITLQHALEQAEIETIVTRGEAEACQLIETSRFDLILIGNDPPELDAAAVVDDFSFRGTCPSVLILQSVVAEKDVEHFYRLGAIGVVPSLDSLAVLERVTNALAPTQFKMQTATRSRSARAA